MNVCLAHAAPEAEAWIVPLEDGELRVSLPARLDELARTALSCGAFKAEPDALKTFSCADGGRIVTLVLAGVMPWTSPADSRRIWLALAAAFRAALCAGAARVNVMLDNAPSLASPAMFERLAGLPEFVDYRFDRHKRTPSKKHFTQAVFVTSHSGLQPALDEGRADAAGTLLARELVDERRDAMRPADLAQRASNLATELAGQGLPVTAEVRHEREIRQLGMESFLAVAKGACRSAPPELIVVRYRGAEDDPRVLALVGKGICFDSGGYSLKSNMRTMFDDMGGAAAVLGALRTVAAARLPLNLTVVIAACENLVSEDAYVPGDIIGSMSGRSIEMLNADAEGRLTLADAITYALREEKAAAVVDIATLTGAASGAVGRRSAVVMSGHECLMRTVREASLFSCEKVWPLPCDEELRPLLDSPFADLRNSVPGNPSGGGAILAGLFLREFAEKRPWLHIDMAPVCYFADGAPGAGKGARGWGASLLYHFVKLLSQR